MEPITLGDVEHVVCTAVKPINDKVDDLCMIIQGSPERRDGGLVADVHAMKRSFQSISKVTLAVVTAGAVGICSLLWRSTSAIEANGAISSKIIEGLASKLSTQKEKKP